MQSKSAAGDFTGLGWVITTGVYWREKNLQIPQPSLAGSFPGLHPLLPWSKNAGTDPISYYPSIDVSSNNARPKKKPVGQLDQRITCQR